MTTGDVLLRAWSWEPSVVAGCVCLAAGYLLLARPLTWRAMAYFAGVLVLLLSLVSPLDLLGDTYLFSAHMAQHLLLVLIVPPLLLAGLSPAHSRRLLAQPVLARAVRVLTTPVLAWLLATSALWVWHLPALYEAALRSEPLHIVEHLFFLGTALLFWWPVVAPAGGERPMVFWAELVYLFSAALGSTLLGVILTLGPAGIYPAYTSPADRLGILPLIREGWGLSPAADQQLGGVLMWVPGGGVYLLAILAAFARWFNEPEDDAGLPVTAAAVPVAHRRVA